MSAPPPNDHPEREVIVGDGDDKVMGAQKDGKPPKRELWRVLVIGIPVMVIAWFFLQWLHNTR